MPGPQAKNKIKTYWLCFFAQDRCADSAVWQRPVKGVQVGGVKNVNYLDLQHAFCSNLLISGATLNDVKEMIGHNDIAMTDRYSHLTRIHKKARQGELAKPCAGEKRGVGYKRQENKENGGSAYSLTRRFDFLFFGRGERI